MYMYMYIYIYIYIYGVRIGNFRAILFMQLSYFNLLVAIT